MKEHKIINEVTLIFNEYKQCKYKHKLAMMNTDEYNQYKRINLLLP